MRTKVFMAGSMLALFILLGSHTAFAQSGNASFQHPRTSTDLATHLAEQLHLSADDIAAIQSELTSGKPMKEVLADHGITFDQIRTAFGAVAKQHHRLSNTEIVSIAKKMGLDPATIQSELDSGKTIKDIFKEHQVTPEQVHTVFGEYPQKHSLKNKKSAR